MVFQPFHKRKVIGQPAQQRHGGMCVQIDQSGHQDVVGQQNRLAGRKARARLGLRQECDDVALINRKRIVFQCDVRRFDRDDPARFDQQVDGNRRR